jgi:hypothetical protein
MKKAEHDANNVDPPSYLEDSVNEYQNESWDQMEDGEKFHMAKHYHMIETLKLLSLLI